MSRTLTSGESRILKLIQTHYGRQNSGGSITWSVGDEATLWVTDGTGASVLMVNLTNLASWRLDSTIASDEDLLRDWLQVEDT